jgi:hypothetical protein
MVATRRRAMSDDSGRIWQDIDKAYRGNPPGEVLAHGWLTDAEVLAEMPTEMLVLEIKRRQLPNGGIIFSDGTAFRMEEVGDE